MSSFGKLVTGASVIADDVDAMFFAMVALCGFVLLAVTVTLVYFSVRYRRGSKADRSGDHSRNLGVELTWTIVPGLLFIGIFAWSIGLFAKIQTMPKEATSIYVVAKQWMWKVQHADGRREVNQLHIPVGKPVRLTMTSQDVIHSFFVPAFRIKQDVLPNRYTQMWFKPEKTGEFRLYCAEFCGTDHALMRGRIVVMEPAAYALWADAGDTDSLAQQGEALFRQLGCSGCHGPAATVHAPDLAGLYGKPVPLSDGSTVTADARYLRDSILLPSKQVAAGYPDIMPTFQNQIDEEDVIALTAYIQSLDPNPNPNPNPDPDPRQEIVDAPR